MPLFVVFLLAGIIQGALRGDTAGMLRMILLRLPGSVLAMSVAVVVTDVLLAVTDDMSTALLADFRDDVEQVGRVLGTLAIGGSLSTSSSSWRSASWACWPPSWWWSSCSSGPP